MSSFLLLHPEPATTSHEVAAGATVASVLVIMLIGAGSVATVPQGNAAWIDRLSAASVAIELLLATILLGQGMLTARLRPIRLGRAYVFAGGMAALSLCIGTGSQSLWPIAHIGFAFAIILYARTGEEQRAPRLWRWSSLLSALAAPAFAAATVLAVVAALANKLAPGIHGQAITCATLSSTLAALALIARRRLRVAADLWLAVAMLASLLDAWPGPAGSAVSVARAGAVLAGGVGLLACVLRDAGALFGALVSTNEILGQMAHMDGLTGLANRRHLDETLKSEWRRAQRDPRPLSLLLIDVDHFKLFNDRYGHLQGDECLRVVAAQIRGMARRGGDLAARYGGEEFALVLPGTDLAGAAAIASALNHAVRAQSIPHEASSKDIVTISIGIATARPRPGETFDGLVARADSALYEAKRGGRDQARMDGALDPDPAGITALPGFRQKPVSQ